MSVDKNDILKERARKLALRKHDEISDSKQFMNAVLFKINGQLYGIDSQYVINITKTAKCFSIPCTPPHVLGISSIRGKIVAVINFASLNGISSVQTNEHSTIIVAGNSEIEFAFYVDKIESNKQLFESEIQNNTANLEKMNKKGWIKAITTDGIILFDIKKILSDETLIVDIN